MLGRQNHLWVRRQLPRSWSRTITILMVMVAVKADFNLAKHYSPEGEGREGGGDDVVGHAEGGVLVNHAGLWLLS